MKYILFGITWASLHTLSLVLPALIMVGGVILWCYNKRKNSIMLLAASQWQTLLIANFSPLKQMVKSSMLVLGFSSLLGAFLQPQWDKKEEPIPQEGRDLYIALDISKSMLAQDLHPSRLDVAKEKIKALLQLLGSERVGLILFSGTAVVQCPLTTDFDAFMMFLNQIDYSTMASGTTALETALQKILESVKNASYKKNKIAVVFTDGEDFSSNLAAVKDEAQNIGLRIITVGVGTTQGSPIPLLDDLGNKKGYQTDDKGSVVISSLNEGILSSLATNVGGFYVGATQDTSDLKKIAAYVDRMEKEKFEDKKIQSLQEQYHYFIGISLLCFILEWFL